jgi:N-acetylornithine carbamoyltransferase
MRHLIDWHLIGDEIWNAAVERALHHYRERAWTSAARERSIALMFFNPSLRTRTSMELAAIQLGAHPTTLTPGHGTWNFSFEKGKVMEGDEAEHIQEAVGVLSRYYDALGVRLFASQTDYAKDRDERLLKTFVDAATVPVVNLESAFYHPCQALADAAAICRHFGSPASRKFVLTWAYHPRPLPMAVPNSALLMASRLGMNVVVARPSAYALDPGVMHQARAYAEAQGGSVTETTEMDDAFDGADVVYAKAWGGRTVYDDPSEEARIRRSCKEWRVTEDRMNRAPHGVFMHCLPVRRNVVVDDAVLDGRQAIHLLQAEFRLHAQKAILEYIWDLG